MVAICFLIVLVYSIVITYLFLGIRKTKSFKNMIYADDFILVTKSGKDEGITLNYTMKEKEVIRVGAFLQNYFTHTESAIDEVNDIINNPNS